MLADLALVAVAYLLGSLSSGLLLARLHGGIDLRQQGSGNIGATNVARVLGRSAGVLTLLGDSAKGLVAVLLASGLGSGVLVTAAAALMAVLGHMFPLYYRFRGGKGVATAAGVFVPTLPLPLLGGLVVWLVVVVRWRYVSLGSLLAAVVVPLLAALLAYPFPLVLVAVVVALLVLYKHRGNIRRLRRGTEAKVF